jgi:trigger factor
MKVTSKELPKSQVELTIELSEEEIAPYVQDAAKRISQEVEVKGFRKGKVPYDVLKEHVGEQVIYEEAFNAIVEETYPKAVDQEKLQVAGRASIDREKLAPGNPVVYKATVPLLPNVTLGNYKSLKARKQAEPVDEKKLEKTFDDLRRIRSKEVLVNRAAKIGDKVLIDFDVKIGGVSIEGGQGSKQGLLLGEGQFIPGFEEAVAGMSKGEEKDFNINFPADYHKKDIAGKPAEVHVKVHEVYEIELPEITDELAKDLNFGSLEELKKEIRSNLERENEQKVNEKFELEVIDEIIAQSQFGDLPDQIVDEEAEKMLAELKHDVQQQGLKVEDYLTHVKKTEDELLKDFRTNAEKRIKAALVMREVALAEAITVPHAEIDAEIEKMKEAYKSVPEMAGQLDSPAYRDRFENMMMHRKVFERLESFTKE